MKKIVAIIEKGEDGGYGIYAADDSIPVVGNGMTEEEARKDFESVAYEQAEYIKKRLGKYPEWFDGTTVIDYRYDMTAFFQAFPFINATELAKSVGINPSLMRKYKSGIVKAGEKQKNLIQQKFDDIAARLGTVRF